LQCLQEELTRPERYDAVAHAMAVLDYVPRREQSGKVPSDRETWTLRLARTPKIIRRIKVWSPRTYLVGFKLEVDRSDERLREIGTAFLRDTRADIVVANDLARIRDEEHPALIVGRGGRILAAPRTKRDRTRALPHPRRRARLRAPCRRARPGFKRPS